MLHNCQDRPNFILLNIVLMNSLMRAKIYMPFISSRHILCVEDMAYSIIFELRAGFSDEFDQYHYAKFNI